MKGISMWGLKHAGNDASLVQQFRMDCEPRGPIKRGETSVAPEAWSDPMQPPSCRMAMLALILTPRHERSANSCHLSPQRRIQRLRCRANETNPSFLRMTPPIDPLPEHDTRDGCPGRGAGMRGVRE